jgi:hypothetical protein
MAKKKNPAPIGGRRRGGKDAVGNGTVHTTRLTEAQQYEAKARHRWPQAIILPPEVGAGPYAVVSYCDATIVSLHPTWERAQECLADLDAVGCAKAGSTRRCRYRRKDGIQHWRHQIVDLREPIMRIDIWPEPNEVAR